MPDTDLEIRGGGGWSSRGGASLQKKFFWPFGPQFGLKIRAGEAGPPGPLPWNAWIRHCNVRHPNFNDFSRYKLRLRFLNTKSAFCNPLWSLCWLKTWPLQLIFTSILFSVTRLTGYDLQLLLRCRNRSSAKMFLRYPWVLQVLVHRGWAKFSSAK